MEAAAGHRRPSPRREARRRAVRPASGAVLTIALLIGGTAGTQDAVANGETRSLSLYHTHTRESLTVTYRSGGAYDERGLEQLNWFLRDWRNDKPTRMDPRLFDAVWQAYREAGAQEPIHIVSAYRAPETNAMLRRRSSGVAENSQHMLGKAMDFYLPDVPLERLRAAGMHLQNGGVGFYPTSGSPFVHLDVGSVRAWPRMSRDQLARIFPDGRTVHLPADGRPLPGYDEARAEILSRGGTVAGVTAVTDATPTRGRSLWASLFGAKTAEAPASPAAASRPLAAATTVSLGAAPAAVGAVRAYAGQETALRAAAGLPARADEPRLVWQAGPAGRAEPSALPPRRPAETAVLALAAAPRAALPPGRPTERPIQVAGIGIVPQESGLPQPVREADRSALRGLFSQASAVRRAAPAVAAVRPAGLVLAAGPVLALGFSADPTAGLSPDRFTGPAVKALPVLR